MAGGKLTPRQKMINLMYLVFIAMLALNMSKEVLSAFGLMNEKFVGVNNTSTESNENKLSALEKKAADDPAKYKDPYNKANQVKPILDEFYKYLEGIKGDITKGFPVDADGPNKGKLPYEAMDKSTIDEVWFSGDGYSAKGNEIVKKINDFNKSIRSILGDGKDATFVPFLQNFDKDFNTGDVKDGEGVTKKYLDYHFKGFPAIASVSKLSAMQNDVRKAENAIYDLLLGNTMEAALSMKNYKAFVMMDKSAFFQGEQVTGRVVLGRYDASTVPTAVSVNGASTSIDNGTATFKMAAGSVGEKDLTGKFTFMENGKPVPIDIKGNYVVVPKPNQAIVSADKMNVVYRGIDNPISVSVPGIPASDVTANAPGMRSSGKPGQYMLKPGQGKEVTINVTAKLPNGGGTFSSKQTYRIKGIPAPSGRVRGESSAKGPKSNLEVCTISAVLDDFDFPVTINVTQFNIKVPGQPTVVVQGSRMNAQAISAIKKAGRGDVVTISEIKVKYVGIDQPAKNVSPCTFEIQ